MPNNPKNSIIVIICNPKFTIFGGWVVLLFEITMNETYIDINQQNAQQSAQQSSQQSALKKWRIIASQFRSEYGETPYRQWVGDLEVHLTNKNDSNELTIFAPNDMVKNYINANYAKWFTNRWRAENQQKGSVVLALLSDKEQSTTNILANATTTAEPAKKPAERKFASNPNCRFDNFIIGPSNESALNMAKTFANDDGLFTSLFIHGEVGVGKTHLLNAIANELQSQNPNMKYMVINSKEFVEKYVESVMQKSFDFKRTFHSVQAIFIDDLHFIIGKQASIGVLEEIFDLFYETGKKIVFTALESPHKLDKLGARLVSRIQGGMVANIQLMDYDTRLAFMEAKAKQKGMTIPSRILKILCERYEGKCCRDCEGLLTRLMYYNGRENYHITEQVGEKFIHDHISSDSGFRPRIRTEDIQRFTAEAFHITQKDILSKVRKADFVYPRHIAMYLSREITGQSFTFLAQKYGRDHSSILHACERIKNMMENDPRVRDEVEFIKRTILGNG